MVIKFSFSLLFNTFSFFLIFQKGEYINDGRLSVVSDLLTNAIGDLDHVKGLIFDKSFRGKFMPNLLKKCLTNPFDESILTVQFDQRTEIQNFIKIIFSKHPLFIFI